MTVDLSQYYNKAEIDQKIADIDINIDGADIDLSNYAKKTDLEPIQTGLQKVSDRVSCYQCVIVKNHYIDGFTTNIESFKNKSISFVFTPDTDMSQHIILSNTNSSTGFSISVNASTGLSAYYCGVPKTFTLYTLTTVVATFDNDAHL